MQNASNKVSTIKRPPVYRIAFAQLAVIALLSVLFLFKSPVAAYSALLGGLICLVPNLYFMWKVFRFSGARHSHLIVQNFYQGGAWKFMLTGLFFAATFILVEPLEAWVLFVSFLIVQLVNWFAGIFANL